MKKINIDFVVGIFILCGFAAFVYLSLQLGEFSFFTRQNNYTIIAEFNNVSGLKEGAVMEIAGVKIGKVSRIILNKDDRAEVHLLVPNQVVITEDSIASIRTHGIIGDKFVRISQGGAEVLLQDGDIITETESAVDLEELVSKYIFGDV
ncbi:MAG: outer membrane lipid asymmetry maintenance protein MlaD [Proteobacteria bacterium]|nr:outer membrane lipid asymmetry maintenance protein MlaD [Pseudomonadota bacterium]MBU1716852.1 outer membrane lipid asymmetry maintenance protein MlaD [Pseudomonadota bacterium]